MQQQWSPPFKAVCRARTTDHQHSLPFTTRNMTWMHHRIKYWHLNDYVIVQRKDRPDVIMTETMRGAGCWTSQRLVFSKLNLRILPSRVPQGKIVPKRDWVSRRSNKTPKEQTFVSDISSCLDALEFR